MGRGPVTCFICGEVGHKSFDCPKSAAAGAGAVSSANRGGRSGGGGRGGHGRGRGGGGSKSSAGGSAPAAGQSASTSTTAAGSSGSSVSGRAVYVGGSTTSVGAAGADGSPSIVQAEQGSGAAAAAVAPAPSVYSKSWSGWNVDSAFEQSSVGAQPWRQVTVGGAQSPVTGVVPVDRSGECFRADLSLPGSVGSYGARVILDSGSALTSIGVGLLSQLSSHFGGAVLRIPLENGPQQARTATGEPVTVTQ